MEISDKILQLLKNGEKKGLEMLFHEFYKPLVMYAYKFIGTQAEAEDIVQEIFVRFWEGNKFVAISAYLRSYLYQAVKNACLNRLDGLPRLNIYALEKVRELAEESSEEDLYWKTKVEEVYAEIDKLPPHTRKIFYAIMVENKQYKEVAEEFKVSVNTVKTLMSRALATLRRRLGDPLFFFLFSGII